MATSAVSITLYLLFSVVILNWGAIKYSNYLRSFLQHGPTVRPQNVDFQTFQRFRNLQRGYYDPRFLVVGLLIHYILFMVLFLPISLGFANYPSIFMFDSDLRIANIIKVFILPWAWTWNILFALGTVFFWLRSPKALQTLPASRYRVPTEFSPILNV